MSCDEIAAGTDWLAELNGPDGEDETYAPARWLTVYDGSGAGDVAFVGPTYADSPRLAGAEERTYPGTDHNALRIRQDIVADYRAFLEEAETTQPVRAAPAVPDRPPQDGSRSGATGTGSGTDAGRSSVTELPATGGGAVGALIAILLAATLRRRR